MVAHPGFAAGPCLKKQKARTSFYFLLLSENI
jgi:hypothetical protein